MGWPTGVTSPGESFMLIARMALVDDDTGTGRAWPLACSGGKAIGSSKPMMIPC